MSFKKNMLLILAFLFITSGLEQRYGLHYDMHTWKYWIGSFLMWLGVYVGYDMLKAK